MSPIRYFMARAPPMLVTGRLIAMPQPGMLMPMLITISVRSRFTLRRLPSDSMTTFSVTPRPSTLNMLLPAVPSPGTENREDISCSRSRDIYFSSEARLMIIRSALAQNISGTSLYISMMSSSPGTAAPPSACACFSLKYRPRN